MFNFDCFLLPQFFHNFCIRLNPEESEEMKKNRYYTSRSIHGLFQLPLLSARDLNIGPEGRYQSRADDKGNMKKVMY